MHYCCVRTLKGLFCALKTDLAEDSIRERPMRVSSSGRLSSRTKSGGFVVTAGGERVAVTGIAHFRQHCSPVEIYPKVIYTHHFQQYCYKGDNPL